MDLVRLVAPARAGFANAVLRRVAERDLAGWLDEVAPAAETDPVGQLALVHAHPEWIVRAFADALGGDLAETARRARRRQRAPDRAPVCPTRAGSRPAELAAEVGGMVGAYSPYAVYLPEGAPGDVDAVVRGRAHVQDEGSQLVALAAADDAGGRGRDERWLDLCAGPGGKAALLGSLAAERGARLTAVEIAPHRARLVEQAVAGMPVEVLRADGREVGSDERCPPAGSTGCCVDAPCTGLGSLRRRPESRWRRQPGDLPPLTRLQRELLGAALRAVRPGGVVAYVTCSPHVVETRVTVAETVRRWTSTVERLDAEPLDARAAARRPAGVGRRSDRPAVAAPARHRRDVPRPAAPRRLTPHGRTTQSTRPTSDSDEVALVGDPELMTRLNGREPYPRVVTAMRAATLVVIATLVALVTLARPAEASARFEPPNVTNQSVPDAEATLKAWDPNVVITYKPGLETLPGGTDPSTVVVTSAEQTNLGVEFEPPLVTVSISPVIPDLVGLTRADAQQRVTAHGFRGVFEPTIAGLDWIVTSQRPAAVGERFRFNATIGMILVARRRRRPRPRFPCPPRPTSAVPRCPPPWRWPRPGASACSCCC